LTNRSGSLWHIWADTGGTFTDCLAVDPAGRLHRAKVLSTSAVRGRIAARNGPGSVRVETGWPVPAGFFRGFTVRLLGDGGLTRTAIDWDPAGRLLHLDGALPPGELAGAAFELRSPEEAPVLAARLVTGTPLDAELPPIAMRLATTRGTNALLERKGAATALFITPSGTRDIHLGVDETGVLQPGAYQFQVDDVGGKNVTYTLSFEAVPLPPALWATLATLPVVAVAVVWLRRASKC